MKPRSPFVWAVLAGLAVLVAAFVPVLWQMLQPQAQVPTLRGDLPAPWQIDRGADGGLKAFGLHLPGSTLADAVTRWGDGVQVALIESRGQGPALEAYVERWTGGGVDGKLVLATNAQQAALQRWRDHATRRETIDAQAQRWGLQADDRAEALRSAVAGLSFLPASRVDAAALQARFGQPALVLHGDGAARHWLYPDQGLAIAWDENTGKAVMQVVALVDFDRRLRAPLGLSPGPATAPLR